MSENPIIATFVKVKTGHKIGQNSAVNRLLDPVDFYPPPRVSFTSSAMAHVPKLPET